MKISVIMVTHSLHRRCQQGMGFKNIVTVFVFVSSLVLVLSVSIFQIYNIYQSQSSQLGERVSAWLGLESRYKSICGEILRPPPHSFKNNWEEIHFEMCTLNYFSFSKIFLADHDLNSFALPNSDTIYYLGCLSSMKGQPGYCFFLLKVVINS